ncbi:hypothetical protein EG329_004948 [Mollisiaceae sp. DMI_Dod_QoI]|nr:hypothetical protein EG329_004948 [Helotiales sp. DMI_Dod_QoI]
MESSRTAADNRDLPPGTVLLFGANLEHDASQINLEPKPTRDPNDPLNWSKWRKWANLTLTLAVTATIFTAISIQTVFWQLMVAELDITYAQLVNSYALNLCGSSLGCIFFIPLAIKYGRRPVYVVSTGAMLALTIWSAKINTAGDVYATNLLLGLAGAPNETIVQMTVADLFFVHQRGTVNGLYMAMVMIGSFLSPTAAGFMAMSYGWRFCYWICSAFMGAIFTLFILFYEETKYSPAIEAITPSEILDLSNAVMSINKEKKEDTFQGEEAPKVVQQEFHTSRISIDTSIPKNTRLQRLRFTTPTDENLWVLTYRPFTILFSFPAVMYTAIQYAFAICWVSIIGNTTALVMPLPPYNFKPEGIGLMNLPAFIGCIIGAIYGGIFADWMILPLAKKNGGYYEPEMRLQLLHVPSLAMPAGVLMFGLTIARGLNWIFPAIGGVLFGFGLGSIGDTALTLVIDSYRDLTGEAFIGIAFVRNLPSIALVFAYTPWVEAQGLQNMYIVNSIICLFVCLLYIPLMIWGKRIRRRTASKYGEFVARNGSVRPSG